MTEETNSQDRIKKLNKIVRDLNLSDNSLMEELFTSPNYASRLEKREYSSNKFVLLNSLGVYLSLTFRDFYYGAGKIKNIDEFTATHSYIQKFEVEDDIFGRDYASFCSLGRFEPNNGGMHRVVACAIRENVSELIEIVANGENEALTLDAFGKGYIISETLRSKGFNYNPFSEPTGIITAGTFIALYNKNIFDRKDAFESMNGIIKGEAIVKYKMILKTKTR
ncbi:MAG: hypothetical protein WC758_01155 [Candidatus Woesearchaeota archaeon]|jgi:hypothetical protein